METDWCYQLARGLIENGCQYLSIALEEGGERVQNLISQNAEKTAFPLTVEQTISEKIGYEIALTYSYGKKRSAFLTHGFSLPVAMDPLMSSIYTGVAGGFVVITIDATPPLPYSTQCDPVSLAMFAKMPVLELSDFSHLSEGLKQAFLLSETYETPVMLHLDTKLPTSQASPLYKSGKRRKTDFEKNPARWAATPRFRFLLHKKLNQRLKDISESDPKMWMVHIEGNEKDLGIICNQANLPFLEPWVKKHGISLLSISMPFPLSTAPVQQFAHAFQKTLIIEDRFPTIQFQLSERGKFLGRMTDARFRKEFSWREETLLPLLDEIRTGGKKRESPPPSVHRREVSPAPLAQLLRNLKTKTPSLTLVADKTPLTTGLPADHFVSRGGAISFAAGMAHANSPGTPPLVLSITDSAALLHYGMQATINAIYNTVPIKCLLMIQPEHTEAVQVFLQALEHVDVVPIDPEAKHADRKIATPSSQPVTFYTVPTEVPA